MCCLRSSPRVWALSCWFWRVPRNAIVVAKKLQVSQIVS